jgi:hypothetical protein
MAMAVAKANSKAVAMEVAVAVEDVEWRVARGGAFTGIPSHG